MTTAPVQPRARHTDPATSHAAAQSTTRRVESIRHHVLEVAYSLHEGFTHRELIAAYRAWPYPLPRATDSSIRTRCHELLERGYIEDTQRRVKGPTGRSEIVWQYRP